MKLFYSWQSDLPEKNTKNFIQEAIKKAIEELNQIQKVAILEFDRDTKGISGTPEIPSTILKKINEADIFIADLSFVYQNDKKGLSNPNVLLEYGFALQCLGDARIIGVVNDIYGKTEKMPFDLKHRRWPIVFTLPENADKKYRSDVQKSLVRDLTKAIKPIMEQGESYHYRFVPDITKAYVPVCPKNFRRLMKQQKISESEFNQEYEALLISYNKLIDILKILPPVCLSFLKICLERSSDGRVLTDEIESCFGDLLPEQIKAIFLMCHQKNLIFNSEIDIYEFSNCPVFVLASVEPHPWDIWQEIKEFAASEKINLSTFIENLDFSSMDE